MASYSNLLLCLALCAISLNALSIELPLQRIARTPQAFLVPFPRIGKRSEPILAENDDMTEDEEMARLVKRFYGARVGKRAPYGARVGK